MLTTPYTAPFEHQTRIYEQSAQADAFGFLMDPGTGKTKLTLDTAMHRYVGGDIKTLLVFGPNGGHRVWPEQAHGTPEEPTRHWDPARNTRTVLYTSRMTAKQKKDAADAIKDEDALVLVSVNIEAMSGFSGQQFVADVLKQRERWGVMGAVDESHKIKAPGSKRTKALLKLRDHLKVKRILTGTPMGKGYENLYSQFAFLDPKIVGCNTYTEFKAWFCVERRFDRFSKIVGYRNTDILLEKLAPFMATQKLDDCADMPGRLPPVPRHSALSDEQRKAYTELRDECLTVLANGAVIDEAMMMVRMTRMQQILSGFIGYKNADGDKVITEFPCPRVDDCVDEILQAPKQVIVWCKWKYDVERLAIALKAADIPYARYYGGLSDDACAAELTRFKSDPSVKVILMSYAKGSESLTILQGTTVIGYSHTWSYLQRTQAYDRSYRLGQTERVRYADFVSEGTMEERMLKTIAHVQELNDLVRDRAAMTALLRAS